MKPVLVLLLASVSAVSCGRKDPAPVPTNGPGDPGTSTYENVHCGLCDKAGNLWFGTTSAGVYCYDGTTLTAITAKDGLGSDRVYSVLEDRGGDIWFGTDAGVCRYDGKEFTPLPLPEPNGRRTGVVSIFQDKAGGMWFGTGSGVYRYDGKVVTSFLADAALVNPKRLKLNDVQQMIEDRAGAIWFASWNNEGVCRYDGKSFGHVKGVEGLSTSCVYAMLEDTAGHLWFATEINGVWRYDGKTFRNLTAKDGLGNDSVFCIVEGGDGHLWFGTRNLGLSRYDGASFTRHQPSATRP